MKRCGETGNLEWQARENRCSCCRKLTWTSTPLLLLAAFFFSYGVEFPGAAPPCKSHRESPGEAKFQILTRPGTWMQPIRSLCLGLSIRLGVHATACGSPYSRLADPGALLNLPPWPVRVPQTLTDVCIALS